MEYKEGDRVICEHREVQFAGTYNGSGVISDINGNYYIQDDITKKLTGIYAAKVGDIVVENDGNERKILEIGNSHNAFLYSLVNKHSQASNWRSFDRAHQCGWKIKGQEEEAKEMTVAEVAEKLGHDVKIVK